MLETTESLQLSLSLSNSLSLEKTRRCATYLTANNKFESQGHRVDWDANTHVSH